VRTILGGTAVTAFSAGCAMAGGVERSVYSTDILFEQGTYAELTFAQISPSVSGEQGTLPSILPLLFPPGAQTGDVANDYTTTTAGFKTQLGENMHVALVFDQPIGADVIYDQPDYLYGTGGGSTAKLTSNALTATLRYEFPSNISVYGGVRYEEVRGVVDLFDFAGLSDYAFASDKSRDWGYLVGVAWEKPEIAARVALTYQSAIVHTLSGTEVQGAGNGQTTLDSSFDTEVPQSVILEAQTGIAADTLLFGSIRWTEWSAFDITPDLYTSTIGGSLVDFDNDVWSYSIGVGRRFNENWSGAVTLGYEQAQGGFSANLGPTDGFVSLGLGVTYTYDNIEISGGARYIWIGDANTESPIVDGDTQGIFTGNSGTAFGLKIAYTF